MCDLLRFITVVVILSLIVVLVFLQALEVPAGVTKATVPDLIEGQPYQFRVRAINKAGPGEPSNETPVVVTRPRHLAPKIDRTNLIELRVRDVVVNTGTDLVGSG